jgi:hypothetical protein
VPKYAFIMGIPIIELFVKTETDNSEPVISLDKLKNLEKSNTQKALNAITSYAIIVGIKTLKEKFSFGT